MNTDYLEKWWPSLLAILKALITNHTVLVEYASNDEHKQKEHQMRLYMSDGNGKMFLTCKILNVKERSNANSKIIRRSLPKDTIITVEEIENGFARISAPEKGWVKCKSGNKKNMKRFKQEDPNQKAENICILEMLLDPLQMAKVYTVADIVSELCNHTALPAMGSDCTIPYLMKQIKTMNINLTKLLTRDGTFEKRRKNLMKASKKFGGLIEAYEFLGITKIDIDGPFKKI